MPNSTPDLVDRAKAYDAIEFAGLNMGQWRLIRDRIAAIPGVFPTEAQPALCECGKAAQFCSKHPQPAPDIAALVAGTQGFLDAWNADSGTVSLNAAKSVVERVLSALTALAAQLAQERERADEAEEELRQTCDLFGRCINRAAGAWRAKNPGKSNVFPDGMEALVAFYDDIERNLELAIALGRAESQAQRDRLAARLAEVEE